MLNQLSWAKRKSHNIINLNKGIKGKRKTFLNNNKLLLYCDHLIKYISECLSKNKIASST